MTLVEFLTARWAEQEAHALKDLWCLDRATPTPWRANYGHNLPTSYLATPTEAPERVATFVATDGRHPPVDGYEDRHERDVMLAARMVSLARARAQHTLADIAAKRKILARAQAAAEREAMKVDHDPLARLEKSLAKVTAPELDRVLRLLATPFADHPDYREEWTTP